MDHRVVWSRRALQDIENIASYIARDSPAYAASVVKAILNETRMLTGFPRSGRKVPELDKDDIREVFAYSYRIIYWINDEEIIVAAVIHGKRLLQ